VGNADRPAACRDGLKSQLQSIFKMGTSRTLTSRILSVLRGVNQVSRQCGQLCLSQRDDIDGAHAVFLEGGVRACIHNGVMATLSATMT